MGKRKLAKLIIRVEEFIYDLEKKRGTHHSVKVAKEFQQVLLEEQNRKKDKKDKPKGNIDTITT